MPGETPQRPAELRGSFQAKVILMSEQKSERELTQQQKDFVLHYTSTEGAAGNAAEAARRARYSEKNAAELGRQLLGKPHVQAAIDAALREAIGTTLTVKAVNVIESILTSQEASLKLKGDMAAKVIEFSGLVERAKAEKAKQTGLDATKPLSQMTRAEIEAVVARGVDIMKMADDLARQSAQPN
jgi:phage terminase small subunit